MCIIFYLISHHVSPLTHYNKSYVFNQERANVKMTLGGLTAHKISLSRPMSSLLTLTVVGCVLHQTVRTLSWKATCFYIVMDCYVK